MGTVRAVVSGNDTSSQLLSEVHKLKRENRQQLLFEAGMTVDIPPEAGVAMKANMALPWTSLRMIRRYHYTITLIHTMVSPWV